MPLHEISSLQSELRKVGWDVENKNTKTFTCLFCALKRGKNWAFELIYGLASEAFLGPHSDGYNEGGLLREDVGTLYCRGQHHYLVSQVSVVFLLYYIT